MVLLTDGSPLNSEARQKQITMLEKIQHLPSNKGRVLHFMWVDSVCHPEYGQTFDISPDMLPVIVAITPKKLRFAHHVGAFTEGAISDFLSGVLGGQKKIIPFSKMPVITSAVTCADLHAKLNQPADKEEEIDLELLMSDDSDVVETKKVTTPSPKSRFIDDEDPDMDAKRRRAEEEIARLNKKSAKKPAKNTQPANGAKNTQPANGAKPTKTEL